MALHVPDCPHFSFHCLCLSLLVPILSLHVPAWSLDVSGIIGKYPFKKSYILKLPFPLIPRSPGQVFKTIHCFFFPGSPEATVAGCSCHGAVESGGSARAMSLQPAPWATAAALGPEPGRASSWQTGHTELGGKWAKSRASIEQEKSLI